MSRFLSTFFMILLCFQAISFAEIDDSRRKNWANEVLILRNNLRKSGKISQFHQPFRNLMKKYPYQTDWFLQDNKNDMRTWLLQSGEAVIEKQLISRCFNEKWAQNNHLQEKYAKLKSQNLSTDNPQWLQLYSQLCELRREARLKKYIDQKKSIVFTKQKNFNVSFYAYTEGQSDAQGERHFAPDSELCSFSLDSLYGKQKTLLKDKTGRVRDPDVSFDGKRVLFAWKKSDRQDDYHLYEMNLKNRKIRQLTEGLGFADYEPTYLPSGDIIFSSTRCVTTVDCWITEVSNLYKCDKNGKYMRRLGFDQVHTNYPKVMPDGRLIYTRWDYNDRGQVFPQPLFQMNPDGTGQTEFYGNNSWFPTSLLHGRPIPGTGKVMALASGHHTNQQGKLCIVDPSKGRQENSGVQLIAPIRETKPVRVDAYGQQGDQFRYPLPINEKEFFVTYAPLAGPKFGGLWRIYWMDIDGNRELLAFDNNYSCNQAMFLGKRKKPPVRADIVDYTKKTGTYYVQDVYYGPAMKGIKRGTVKELRVVELLWKSSPIGNNFSSGPAGYARVCIPNSIGNGAWDVKKILGTTKVYQDGSAFFTVPANTPVYFQLLDEKGYVVQTMRTWSTLMPGENFACIGCHEDKNSAPPMMSKSQALKAGPQALKPFATPARGFSFLKDVQPILDKHCISCHSDSTPLRMKLNPNQLKAQAKAIVNPGSQWKYTLKQPKNGWFTGEFDDSAWQNGQAGFGTITNNKLKSSTKWSTKDIWLRKSFTLTDTKDLKNLHFQIAHDEDVTVYINGKKVLNLSGYTTDFRYLKCDKEVTKLLKKGENLIAVHCKQTAGGQFVDVALLNFSGKASDSDAAFSLKGTKFADVIAKRNWTESYMQLTNAAPHRGTYMGHPNETVNWITSQSVPELLPPYFKGAAKSKMMKMLEKGHSKTNITSAELRKIATWIDLGVPFCGDYTEANTWTEKEMKQYKHYLNKRHKMEKEIEQNVRELLKKGSKTDSEQTKAKISPKYRNLALKTPGSEYPKATTNNVCRNLACFAADNVINGKTANLGHGATFPSWGPEKREDLWLKIDFGKKIKTNKIVIYIRADFPHDKHWHSATLKFSDGSKLPIKLKKTAEKQEFTFQVRVIDSVTITDLVQEKPLGWCGLSEVEVWGKAQ